MVHAPHVFAVSREYYLAKPLITTYTTLISLLRMTYYAQHPPLSQGNSLPKLQIFDLPLQVLTLPLRHQVLPSDRFQLLIGQFAYKLWGKDLRRLRSQHCSFKPKT